MSSTLIKNIKQLTGINDAKSALRNKELARLVSINDAYLIIEGEDIAAFGPMHELRDKNKRLPEKDIDATGRIVLPAWCDSHTHLVFAGSREDEFVDKIRGFSYSEIAAKGGGILNSAKRLADTSEEQLFIEAHERLQEAMKMGTANFEIKSGYGLTLDEELKMLRVIRRLRETCRAGIKSTFLGAHAVPAAYADRRHEYVSHLINDMIPRIATDQLADYIDVFCEKGFFSVEETENICKAGILHGMKPRIHANQLSASGAVEAGVRLNAVSVDHLEIMDNSAINALAASATIGTLLPAAAFFLRAHYQPARELIDSGCAVALASDCNPGSAPGYNMNFVVSLACVALRMLPEEAINAATFNGACALEIQSSTGSITVGKKADLIVTKPVPSIAFLPYSFSSVLVERTIVKGDYSTFS